MNCGALHNVGVEFYATFYKAGNCLRLDLNWQPSRSITPGAADE